MRCWDGVAAPDPGARHYGVHIVKGFRSFLLRGNVVDLAVGIVVGTAFTAVVNGFVKDFLTPIIGLVGGSKGDFNKHTFSVAGTTFGYGDFIGDVISFVLIAAVVYFCVVLPINTLHTRLIPKQVAPVTTKDCPECLSAVPLAATRCAFCTVELAPRQGVPQQTPVGS
ncbi:large conductance mechanosensitive channel protein MscL [Streptacidiphilus sp. 4-A2]|nr:large conductance mechanosensitive channel protein MscL [Streptacidiphilus sp. 4-A2]